MADFLDFLDEVDIVERMIRREAVVRRRANPLNEYDDQDFLARFRLTKPAVEVLLGHLGRRLDRAHKYATSVLPMLQLLVALRFYATSSFLMVDGDIFGLHKCTVSRIVARVSRAIASLRPQFIQFPGGRDANAVQRQFFEIAGVPGVVGAIDCTHIPIRSPGGLQAELFRNRKDFFSINVQVSFLLCHSLTVFTEMVYNVPFKRYHFCIGRLSATPTSEFETSWLDGPVAPMTAGSSTTVRFRHVLKRERWMAA